MYYGEYTEAAAFDEELAVTSSYARDALLQVIRDDAPPRPVVFRAWAEAYMTHAFHHCPVIEPQDLADSAASSIVKKAVSMVANLMRHDPSALKLAAELYERLKIMISMDAIPDTVQALKVICLLTSCGLKPSTPVSLDGTWHWVGIGLSLVVRMGLHRESTHTGRPDVSCLRRMLWYLLNSERLLITSWGYPPHLRHKDLDIRMATLDDFGSRIFQGLWFIESTKLCTIASRVSDLRAERRQIRLGEHADIELSLVHWITDLPMDLRLFDQHDNRNAYSHQVSELAIQYFVTIITNEFLRYRENAPTSQGIIISLVAGSCGANLYDEILARDETIFLPHTHGFFCLALALPLLHYLPQSPPRAATRERDLGTLRSVLTANSDRWGDAKLYMRMIDRLQSNMASNVRQMGSQNEVTDGQSLLEAQRLLPFPRSFCENLDLLEPSTCINEHFSVNDFAMSDDGLFDLTWLESMGVALGNTGSEFDDV